MAEQKKASSKRSRILDAAGQVFYEQGFAGARVDEIARRAGVNKAMLYYHVGDKKALFTAVLIRYLEQTLARVEDVRDEKASAEENFRCLISALARATAEADHISLIMREASSGGANIEDEVLPHLMKLLSVTREVITRGQNEGRFIQINPLFLHLMMVGTMMLVISGKPMRERMYGMGLLPGGTEPSIEVISALVSEVILNGIRRTPDTADSTDKGGSR